MRGCLEGGCLGLAPRGPLCGLLRCPPRCVLVPALSRFTGKLWFWNSPGCLEGGKWKGGSLLIDPELAEDYQDQGCVGRSAYSVAAQHIPSSDAVPFCFCNFVPDWSFSSAHVQLFSSVSLCSFPPQSFALAHQVELELRMHQMGWFASVYTASVYGCCPSWIAFCGEPPPNRPPYM